MSDLGSITVRWSGPGQTTPPEKEKVQESPQAEEVRLAERSEAHGSRYKIIIFVHVFPCVALSPWLSRGVDVDGV